MNLEFPPDEAQIIIFYAEICDLCHRAMNFFRERDLSFYALEVHWDEAAQQFKDSDNTRLLFKMCGEEVDIVPQIFVNGHHIRGWKTLEPMIQSGEMESLLIAP